MDIKEYLLKAKDLETSLYEQHRAIKNLTSYRNSIKNSHKRKSISSEFTVSGRGYDSIKPLLCGGLIVGSIIGLIVGLNTLSGEGNIISILFQLLWHIIITIILYAIIFGSIGLVLGLLIGFIGNLIETPKINRENAYIRSSNAEAHDFNNKLDSIEKHQQSIVDEEINIMQGHYKQTSDTLRKLYSIDIIFPKYRGLVPICSFYEYFCSGRCSALEGHEGAYNIYENELRQNLIIGKLDIVIDKLDQIESSQYILYDAIKSTNRNLNMISNEMTNMTNKLQRISDSTQMIEYNTIQTRRNTDILTWLEIYNSDKA